MTFSLFSIPSLSDQDDQYSFDHLYELKLADTLNFVSLPLLAPAESVVEPQCFVGLQPGYNEEVKKVGTTCTVPVQFIQ